MATKRKKKLTEAQVRKILRNAVIRTRRYLLEDGSDLMSVTDDLGDALHAVDGEWPANDIEED